MQIASDLRGAAFDGSSAVPLLTIAGRKARTTPVGKRLLPTRKRTIAPFQRTLAEERAIRCAGGSSEWIHPLPRHFGGRPARMALPETVLVKRRLLCSE